VLKDSATGDGDGEAVEAVSQNGAVSPDSTEDGPEGAS